MSAISPPRHCVFAGVLRVTPRFRRAWIHFWQHLLLRETPLNKTIRRGDGTQLSWTVATCRLAVYSGRMAASLRAFQGNGPGRTEIQRRDGGNRFHVHRSRGRPKGRRKTDRQSLRPPCQRASKGNCSQRPTEGHFIERRRKVADKLVKPGLWFTLPTATRAPDDLAVTRRTGAFSGQ